MISRGWLINYRLTQVSNGLSLKSRQSRILNLLCNQWFVSWLSLKTLSVIGTLISSSSVQSVSGLTILSRVVGRRGKLCYKPFNAFILQTFVGSVVAVLAIPSCR